MHQHIADFVVHAKAFWCHLNLTLNIDEISNAENAFQLLHINSLLNVMTLVVDVGYPYVTLLYVVNVKDYETEATTMMRDFTWW